MKKKIQILGLSVIMTISSVMPAFAGWYQDVNKKRWINEDGSLAANGWKWIDDDGDGVKECFYFDANGYLLMDVRTPDGYTVNAEGEWIVNGEIQREYPEVAEPEPKVQVVTVESVIAENKDFLDRVLNAATTGNNDAVFAEMGYNSNLIKFRNQLPKETRTACYPSENGVGILIDKYQDSIYYGPLVNGSADGHGKGYYVASPYEVDAGARCYFDGAWANNAPNGYGIETRQLTDKTSNKYPLTLVVSGNYTNWHENGNMTRIYTSSKTGESRTFKYEAYNGLGISIGRNWFAQEEHDIVARAEEDPSCMLTFYETEQSALTRGAKSHLDKYNRGFAHNSWYFDANWNY